MCPQPEQTVKADLEAITPGSSLASKDPGTMVTATAKEVGTTKTYNEQSNTNSDYRFGYVAVVDGNSQIQ